MKNKRIALAASGILMMSLTSCGSGGGNISKKLSESWLANMSQYKSIGVMNSKDLAKNKKSRIHRRDDVAGDAEVIVGENAQGIAEALSFVNGEGSTIGQDGLEVREMMDLGNYLIIDACLEKGHEKIFEADGSVRYSTKGDKCLDDRFCVYNNGRTQFAAAQFVECNNFHHDCFITTKDGFKMYSMTDIHKSVFSGHKRSDCQSDWSMLLRAGTDKLIIGMEGVCQCQGIVNLQTGGIFEVSADDEKLSLTQYIGIDFVRNAEIDLGKTAIDDSGNLFSPQLCVKSDGSPIASVKDQIFKTPVYCQNGKVAFVQLESSERAPETQRIDPEDNRFDVYEGGSWVRKEYERREDFSFNSLRSYNIHKYNYYFYEKDGVRFYIDEGNVFKQTVFDEYTYLNEPMCNIEKKDGSLYEMNVENASAYYQVGQMGNWVQVKGNVYRFNKNLSTITTFDCEREVERVFTDLRVDNKSVSVSSVGVKNGYLHIVGTLGFEAAEWYINDEGELVDEVVSRTPQITTYFYPIN